jgi:hypothetical protein
LSTRANDGIQLGANLVGMGSCASSSRHALHARAAAARQQKQQQQQ